MTRDNLLFTVVGLLAGFILGYFTHEIVVSHQPPRVAAPAGVAAPSPAAAAPVESAAQMEQVQQLRQYVEQNPDDLDAALRLANLNYDIGNWQAAADLYQRVVAARPGDPDVLTDLGVTLREQGRHEEALERFTAAQAIDPSHWQSVFNQVVVLAFDLGRFEEARQALDRLRELQPGNPDVDRLGAEVERRAGA